ncbi:MAG TPA: hypothetical protein VFP83_04420, partial [Candidatus Limnocylindria bacterium]|nr:hypothetical protein [Candidatus Limnocylindria bacterium]
MKTDTDNDLERQLRTVLRQELDREHGPDPAWDESPAARRVAVREGRRPSRWTLRVLAVAALITIGVGSALLLSAPDALGRNGWIAQSSGGDIYFLAPDQEVRRVIGTDGDGVSEGCPAFSQDGRQLAYGRVAGEVTWNEGIPNNATYQDSALIIAGVADDGHVTEQATYAIGDGLPPPCPVWSPTGDRIAFAVPLTSTGNPTQSAEGSEVWIVTLADRSITVLPDLLATDLEFSPDGTLLAIASGRDLVEPYVIGSPRIHLYELASGITRTMEGTLGVWTFTWSPDGGRIAYQGQELRDNGYQGQELRIIEVATEEERVISGTYGTLHGIGPVWAPDGESILYQRCEGPYGTCRGERHEVVLVWPDDLSAEGAAREEAFTLFDRPTENIERELWPYWVTWSPDGAYLLFSAWPDGGRSLLGVAPSVPGSPSAILVSDLYPFEDPDETTYVY